MIFDAGVFIALDNPSKRRVVIAIVEKLQTEGVTPATTEPILAQAWRQPATQVPIARLVDAISVYPFGDAKTVGARCAQTATSDVVDASLAVLGDQLQTTILTTDPTDMQRLGARHIAL